LNISKKKINTHQKSIKNGRSHFKIKAFSINLAQQHGNRRFRKWAQQNSDIYQNKSTYDTKRQIENLLTDLNSKTYEHQN
jgi:hypothetical protein